MPRKNTTYTHEFPYHITARANNREWFYLEKSLVWKIIVEQARRSQIEESFLIHAFVLMDNHYHLIATTHPKFPLGVVMQNFQRRISRQINCRAERINHVFGGPYKPSLITNEVYYSRVIRYLYQNPVAAGLCKRVEDYPFSTLVRDDLAICSPIGKISSLLPPSNFISFLNTSFDPTELSQLRRGLRKTVFKPAAPLLG